MRKVTLPLLLLMLSLIAAPRPAAAQSGDQDGVPPASLLEGALPGPSFIPAGETSMAPMFRRDDNPVVEVARSTLYGALAGTVLGLAAALVVEDHGETVKWGFVIGTFGGFIWGVTYASRRPAESALLQTGLDGHLHVGIPAVDLRTGAPGRRQVRLDLLSFSLDPR